MYLEYVSGVLLIWVKFNIYIQGLCYGFYPLNIEYLMELESVLGCCFCILYYYFFFICYLADPRPTLEHYLMDILTHAMLTSTFYQFSTRRLPGATQRGWVPKAGRALSGVWTGNFPIQSHCINPIGHYPLTIFRNEIELVSSLLLGSKMIDPKELSSI